MYKANATEDSQRNNEMRSKTIYFRKNFNWGFSLKNMKGSVNY